MKSARAFVLAVGTLGCEESLKPVDLIEEPRLLGARVEVVGDPERAAPAPGETVTVTLLLAAPESLASVGYAVVACAASDARGRPQCAGNDFFEASGFAMADEPVRFAFQVPRRLASEARVLLRGAVCPSAKASEDRTCHGELGKPFTLDLELARDGDVNRNPSLQPSSVRFDGRPWSDESPGTNDCADAAIPQVTVGSRHDMAIQIDEADRDALPRASELDPDRESLQLSHFATAGELDRAFESIAWNRHELLRTTSFAAPNEPGLVRFWIVLRDLRGGADFVSRFACVR